MHLCSFCKVLRSSVSRSCRKRMKLLSLQWIYRNTISDILNLNKMSTQISQVSCPSPLHILIIHDHTVHLQILPVPPWRCVSLPVASTPRVRGSLTGGSIGKERCGWMWNQINAEVKEHLIDIDIWWYLIMFPTEMNRVFHSIAFNASTEDYYH